MDDDETLLRRARLRELIDAAFDGKLANLIAHIANRTGETPNQGELSSLRKDNGPKSFGDKKAKRLAEQIGLHRYWFSMPKGTNLDREKWQMDSENAPLVRSGGDALRHALHDWRIQASPNSRRTIDKLSVLAQKNALRDEDWILLDQIAARLRKSQN